ncbi:hypothetical protein G7046_g3980 [Stylonectria norvegica]|nr:hypothetical protein G7046_g3980 [Stylonectria norvegica]
MVVESEANYAGADCRRRWKAAGPVSVGSVSGPAPAVWWVHGIKIRTADGIAPLRAKVSPVIIYRWACGQSTSGGARIPPWHAFEALLALSAVEFAGTPLLQWTQFTNGLVVLRHLTIGSEDPFWNRVTVRAVVNMPELFERVAERIRELCAFLKGSMMKEHRADQDEQA